MLLVLFGWSLANACVNVDRMQVFSCSIDSVLSLELGSVNATCSLCFRGVIHCTFTLSPDKCMIVDA